MVGNVAATQALLDWLWIGPPTAAVMQVDVEEVPLEELTSLPRSFLVQ
jgi:hypothetical protein